MKIIIVISSLFFFISCANELPRKRGNLALSTGDQEHNLETVIRKRKKVVLIAGDQEYRSEEVIPQLNKILKKFHKKFIASEIIYTRKNNDLYFNPTINNIPNLTTINNADLIIVFLRFLDLPNEQMKIIDNYLKKGKPIIGIRTSTHAFNIRNKKSPWYKYHWKYKGEEKTWHQGFGKLVLGETWKNHHGAHGKEATQGKIVNKKHPIARGVKDENIFGLSDVYGIYEETKTKITPIVNGIVLSGMKQNTPPVKKKNNPPMPIVWTKVYKHPQGKKGISVTSTIGAAIDFQNEGVRKLLVNSIYWLLGLERKIPSNGSKVNLVGNFKGSMFSMKTKRDYWEKKKLILR